jgi:hypothetical protein
MPAPGDAYSQVITMQIHVPQDTKPFFAFGASLTLAAINTDYEEKIQFPSDADFLVQHLDIAIYDQDGAIYEELRARDEIRFTINDENSGNNYFNAQQDVFMIRRFSQAIPFRSFLLPARTQLKITAKVTNFVNGGTPVGSFPYKLNISFLGRKVNGAV